MFAWRKRPLQTDTKNLKKNNKTLQKVAKGGTVK